MRFLFSCIAVAVVSVVVIMEAQPKLGVSLQGTNVVISWPATNSTNFVLQQRPELTGSNQWTTVSITPIAGQSNVSVTLSPTNIASFFRLFLAASNIVDDPDDAFLDSNEDGIDGTIAKAIFVSPNGNDSKSGTMVDPVQTLRVALSNAIAQSKSHIYLAGGIYTATNLVLVEGISIYGGYSSADWSRSDSIVSRFNASLPTAAIASNLTNSTTLDHLTIASADATNAAQSSYGILASASPGMIVRKCTILAGKGADGAGGTNGNLGPNGGNGGFGLAGCEQSVGIGCTTCSQPLGGPAGGSPCGKFGGVGGVGGHGSNGGGNGAAGVGGSAGGSGASCGGTRTCDGLAGTPGANGVAGMNGAAAGIGVFAAGYSPGFGENGVMGSSGNGGGGGGGGGGGDDNCDSYGSSGGGGGGGGCGGMPGGGGQSGGGSFGIFLWNSTAKIESCTITTSDGGNGGNGGSGGSGGTGGLGGAGGVYGGSDEQDDGGDGAPGGKGGNGGRGGHGGGGAGGPSIGIVRSGTSSPQIDSVSYTLGKGGSGGASSGNAGPTGLSVAIYP